jgi:hypothetical protein
MITEAYNDFISSVVVVMNGFASRIGVSPYFRFLPLPSTLANMYFICNIDKFHILKICTGKNDLYE